VKLPLLISVPHVGLRIPSEVEELCALTPEEILKDSDEGAAEIYALRPQVRAFVTTGVARAIIDLNRSEEDFGPDGVVKTHTCWNVPVYRKPIREELIEILLDLYYRPYHKQLTEQASSAVLGIDCHTMSSVGPPLSANPGSQRPEICLSNANGTCPEHWFSRLISCFETSFGIDVSVNSPFRGGQIIRAHAAELPWVQLEISRAPFLSLTDKRKCVLEAFSDFCRLLPDT
jgi:N-formylglutamate amidohydrolase